MAICSPLGWVCIAVTSNRNPSDALYEPKAPLALSGEFAILECVDVA